MSTPPDPLDAFRCWIVATLDYGDPVRAEAVRNALSATLQRLLKFGMESSLAHHRCRDLLQFQAMGKGPLAEHLLRVAFTRAVVEDDRLVIDAYRRFAVVPEQSDWFDRLDGSAADAVEAAAAIADPEERAVTRLVLARRHPGLIAPAWWWEVPDDQPLIAFQLVSTALRRRPDLAAAIPAFLEERRAVLFAGEPDEILAALVRAEGSSPQTVLAAFEGCYGDGTLLAAAEWHLEHAQPAPALELSQRIRQLSVHHPQALLVAGLALIDLGRCGDALRLAGGIADPGIADRLIVRLARADPAMIGSAAIAAIGGRCRPEQPELFFAVLQLLLARRDLAAARILCDARAAAFAGHPAIAAAARAISGGGGA